MIMYCKFHYIRTSELSNLGCGHPVQGKNVICYRICSYCIPRKKYVKPLITIQLLTF